MNRPPHAYLITFRTYGTWLRGDGRGSVELGRATARGSPTLVPSERWRADTYERMTGEPVLLSRVARRIVHAAIGEVCEHRVWSLLALNARTNHVHVVLAACDSPAVAMVTFKAWSTRRMREAGIMGPEARIWSRHGSTRYLWTEPAVQRAVAYVTQWQD